MLAVVLVILVFFLLVLSFVVLVLSLVSLVLSVCLILLHCCFFVLVIFRFHCVLLILLFRHRCYSAFSSYCFCFCSVLLLFFIYLTNSSTPWKVGAQGLCCRAQHRNYKHHYLRFNVSIDVCKRHLKSSSGSISVWPLSSIGSCRELQYLTPCSLIFC